jgi:hypothetical protein
MKTNPLGTRTTLAPKVNLKASIARTARGNKFMANSTGGGFLLLLLFVPQTAITIDVATIGFARYSDWILRTNRATKMGMGMGMGYIQGRVCEAPIA